MKARINKRRFVDIGLIMLNFDVPSQMKSHKMSLYTLLTLDISLILINTAMGFLVKSQTISAIPYFLNIGTDWSLGEIFNYGK